MRPRNLKTNQQYRNAVARARGRALQRLANNHPIEYQRLLADERTKAGISYIRKPKVRATGPGPHLSTRCQNDLHALCSGRAGIGRVCECDCHKVVRLEGRR